MCVCVCVFVNIFYIFIVFNCGSGWVDATLYTLKLYKQYLLISDRQSGS